MAGVVYNPATDDMFIAEKGQGAYHNNRRIRVAARETLAESMIACGIPPLAWRERHERFQVELAAAMAKVGNIRRWAPPPSTSPWWPRALRRLLGAWHQLLGHCGGRRARA